MENKNVENALRFVKATGLPVFPVRTQAQPGYGAKSPFIKAPFESSSTDENTIKAWGTKFRCAFATHPGRGGYAVIDLDNHGGKQGEESLFAWVLDSGNIMPATLRVQTPSGGWHLWFKDTALTGGKDGFLEGVDVHGGPGAEGRYVLLPGQTIEAGSYTVKDKRPLAELPESVAAAVNAARAPKSEKKPAEVTAAAPAGSLDFAGVLNEIAAMEPLKEGGRDNALIAMCLRWKEQGFSPSVYVALMRLMQETGKIENPQDFTESDFSRIAQSAWKKSSAVYGSASMEALLPKNEGFEELRDIMAAELPPQEWLIKDLIPAGAFGVFGGNAKSGKTYLCLQMARAIAAGVDFLGFKVPEKRTVLYVYLEGGKHQVKRRYEELFPAEEVPTGLHFTFKYAALDAGGIAKLKEDIARYKASLVIVDTWQRARVEDGRKGATAYQKEYREISTLINEICVPSGCTLLMVHHLKQLSSRDAGMDVLNTFNGSAAISGASDFSLFLSRERGADTARFSAHGRDFNDVEINLVKGEVMLWRRSAQEAGSLILTPETEFQQRLVEVLQEAPEEGMTARELATEAPELNYNTISVQLNRWAKEGLLDKHGKKFRLFSPSEE